MKCLKCGHDIPVGANFCPECGAAAVMVDTDTASIPELTVEASPYEAPKPELIVEAAPYEAPKPELTVAGSPFEAPKPEQAADALPHEIPAADTGTLSYETPEQAFEIPPAPVLQATPLSDEPKTPVYENSGADRAEPESKPKGLAIAALVLAILSVLLFWIPVLGTLPALAGVVCGALGIRRSTRVMSLVSLIISAVFLVISIAYAVLIIGLIASIDWGGLLDDVMQAGMFTVL